MYWNRLIHEAMRQEASHAPGFKQWWEQVRSRMELRERATYDLIGDLEGVRLTQREAECVVEASLGYTNKETARHLQISPRTVEYYLQNVRMKTQSDNRFDMLSKMIKTGALAHLKLDMLMRTVQECQMHVASTRFPQPFLDDF